MTQITYLGGYYECLSLIDSWARFQHDYGWLASKRIEPLGTSYLEPEFQGIRHERAVRWAKKPEVERVFCRVFTALLLDNLVTLTAAQLAEMIRVGALMFQYGTDIDEKRGLSDPVSGVPLLNDSGIARIEKSLLDVLAFSRHEAWMAAREWSWEQDDKRLHQPKRKAHRRWNEKTPDKEKIPDQVRSYGDCLMLAIAPKELRSSLINRAQNLSAVHSSV
jgi:hypothetical protein